MGSLSDMKRSISVPEKKPTAKALKKPAGQNPAEEITSKADLIRKVAGIIKAKGERPRPSDIVKILKEEGVDVFPAQVSLTLKAAGYRPLRKRRKGEKAAAGGVAGASVAGKNAGRKALGTGRLEQISIDDLLEAKRVAGAFGGTDKAIAALQALRRFEG
jgi:hypothetical protein